MTDPASQWRSIAAEFTDRVQAVADGEWDNPTPCDGWVARDIISHLVEWVPPFLEAGADVTLDGIPSVDDDPAAAWAHLDGQIRNILDDEAVADQSFDHPQAGKHPLDVAIERFVLGDVFLHTWDLARATGQDETLDSHTVDSMLEGLAAMGDALQESGQYGPPVSVAADADSQTKLLALTGRQP